MRNVAGLVFAYSTSLLRRRVSTGATLALLLFAAKGQAEGAVQPLSRLTLHFVAPAGCPDSSVVLREIQEFTEGASSSELLPLVAHGEVEQTAEGFSLSLSLRDNGAQNKRTLVAPTCDEVAHAAALIIAMAINPSVLERQKTMDASAPPNGCHCRVRDVTVAMTEAPEHCAKADVREPPNCPSPVVIAPPQTKEGLEKRASRNYRLGLSTFGSYQVLPGFALGQAVFGAYQSNLMRLELALSELSRGAVHGSSARTADMALYRASAKGCWSVAQTSWFVAPCVSLEGGLMRAQGHGVSFPRQLFAPWFSSSVGMFAEAPVTEAARLGLAAELGVPILRESYVISGEQIYKPGISGTLGLSLSAGW